MQKRMFIIHSWGGYPEEGWFPWLKKELEKRDFEVQIPAMPNSEKPKIDEWIPHLKKIVGKVDGNTYFVGHSIGCQAILRYVQTLDEDERVGGCVFVAGFFNLTGESYEEEGDEIIAKPWLEMSINFDKILKHTKNFTAIFSNNDPFVLVEENSKIFKEELGAKIIIENQKGHFSGSDGITELPSVLESIFEIAGVTQRLE